jgi:hypothetical protein
MDGVKVSPPANGPLVTFGGRYLYKPNLSSGVITNDDLSDAVFWNNKVNGMPINDNGVYMIMFYGNLILKEYIGEELTVIWPNDYCGYHQTFGEAKVGIVGDPATVVPLASSGCLPFKAGDVTPNNDFSADNFMSVYAHELVEVATDAFGM